MPGLKTQRLPCDEIWPFCYPEKKNTPESLKGVPGVGDVWTWTAIDADSKLMVSWSVGDRTNACAREIMNDVADRIVSDRVQLTSDGYHYYAQAVALAFGDSVDYSQIEKIYGVADDTANARYSPAVCIVCVRKHVMGAPDPAHVSTS